ncbi:hypothetical protein MCHI_001690 [Candidatus Magnetoovum chiemensis]|nr:hypothetical protein MCHI_001690 [Candidatus Magnetoovum chiemensis]
MHPNSGKGKYYVLFDGRIMGPQDNPAVMWLHSDFKVGYLRVFSLIGYRNMKIIQDIDSYLAYLDTLTNSEKKQLKILEKGIRLYETGKKPKYRNSEEKIEYFIRSAKTELKISRIRKKSISEIEPGYYEINGKIIGSSWDHPPSWLIDCGSTVIIYRFNKDLQFNEALIPKIGEFVKGKILLYALDDEEFYYHDYDGLLPEDRYVTLDTLSYYWKIEDIFYALSDDRKILENVPIEFKSLDGKTIYKRIGETILQKHYDEYEKGERFPLYLVGCRKLDPYTRETIKKYKPLIWDT